MHRRVLCGFCLALLLAAVIGLGCEGGPTDVFTPSFPGSLVGSWQGPSDTWLSVRVEGNTTRVAIGQAEEVAFTPDSNQPSSTAWVGTLQDSSTTRVRFGMNSSNSMVLTTYNSEGGVASTTTYTRYQG